MAFAHPEPKPPSHRLIMRDRFLFRQTLLEQAEVVEREVARPDVGELPAA